MGQHARWHHGRCCLGGNATPRPKIRSHEKGLQAHTQAGTHLPGRVDAGRVGVVQLGLVAVKANDEARDAVRPLAVALGELLLGLCDEACGGGSEGGRGESASESSRDDAISGGSDWPRRGHRA